LGTALFWVFTQREVVIYSQSFGKNLSVPNEDESMVVPNEDESMVVLIYLAVEA
jgi:hypothetical protein